MGIMTAVPTELHQATENLIENLLASESFLMYQRSASSLNHEQKARALLDRLAALQTELRRKQTTNSLTQKDIEELHNVQAQAQANTVIMGYIQSQQEAVNFLHEINQEISQALGVDFAALAKQSTCC